MSGEPNSVSKVLIVDDHPIMCEGLRQLIDHEDDFTVCGVEEDVEGARRAIAEEKPDLVIVDLNLKGQDGLRLVVEHPTLPMLVLSMHEAALYIERSLRAGARGYLTKQEGSMEVLQALRAVRRGEIYLSDGQPLPEDPVNKLTKRQFEVFKLVGKTAQGNQRIAEELHVSVKTVESHKSHIMQKLGLESTTELIRYAMRWFERNEPPEDPVPS